MQGHFLLMQNMVLIGFTAEYSLQNTCSYIKWGLSYGFFDTSADLLIQGELPLAMLNGVKTPIEIATVTLWKGESL